MSHVVKICGLKTPDALEVALECGADMVGFVFFASSPRNVSFEIAGTLGAQARGRAAKVALSVDAGDALIEAIIAAVKPDVLQLHGQESVERVSVVKRRFGVPVMKAIHVAAASDLGTVSAYAAITDRLLFDARPPRGATRPGGLGVAFDWRLLHELDPGLGFMLSGGLNPDNVAAALVATRAAGVDVSSGVERAPGEKDPDKIRDFIRGARQVGRRAAMSTASIT
jgi:phosphoribosylanthranilate isomerase